MDELLQLCLQHKITLNQMYLLYSIREKVKTIGINVEQELRSLPPNLLKDNRLTSESIELLSRIELLFKQNKKKKENILGENYEIQIEKYRMLFPTGKLPSNKPARQPASELKTKFIWFFANYPYTWEIILKATENYIEEYRATGFMYMRSSAYFISKQDNNKAITSELAAFCELAMNETETENKYYTPSMK